MRGFNYIAFTALLTISAAAPASAETVSQKEAKRMAQVFFDQVSRESTAPVQLAYTGKRLTTDRLFTPFYVYNQPRGGFVIISAENKAFPILGYSLKTSFNADDLTETERAWLKSFARDIELIRYDPRVPEEAIEAWQNYPRFVVDLLGSPYSATDTSITPKEAEAILYPIVYSAGDDSTDAYFSALYTPAQWEDMISSQLASEGEVTVGYVDERKEVYPAVVHGRRGDYFRIEFDRPNDWLLRLMPAEYMGERQVAMLSRPAYTPEPEPEETPFEFHDSYIASLEEASREAEEERMAIQSDPIITTTGAGHFDVLLPENARLAMIYNLNGSHIGRATYSGQPMAHINIEKEPSGFYFAVIYGESGRPYGIKFYR